MKANGADQRQVTSMNYATFPDWSPNGRRIAFGGKATAADANGDILVVRPDGSGLVQLTKNAGANDYPHVRRERKGLLMALPRDFLDEIATELRVARTSLAQDCQRLAALEELLDLAAALGRELRRPPTVFDVVASAQSNAERERRVRLVHRLREAG